MSFFRSFAKLGFVAGIFFFLFFLFSFLVLTLFAVLQFCARQRREEKSFVLCRYPLLLLLPLGVFGFVAGVGGGEDDDDEMT
jgi:hypothetical protein